MTDPQDLKSEFNVLVVDDNPQNLELLEVSLPGDFDTEVIG